jgi:hypothetical protein
MRFRFPILTLAYGWLALAGTAPAQVPVFLPEFPIVENETLYRGLNGIVMNPDGEFVVVWGQDNGGAAGYDVMGRRFDAQTAPIGNPAPLTGATTGRQCCASISKNASGRFVLVWNDIGDDLRARRFAADGTPEGGSFQVNSSSAPGTSYFSLPDVALDASGNFVVTWTLQGDDTNILARRFDREGTPLSNDFTVNQYTTGLQYGSRVAASAGGFVVTWTGQGDSVANSIFGRVFDAAGQPVTNDFPIPPTPPAVIGLSSVAMNAAGDFVAVWHDQDASSYVLQGRRFSASGAPASGVFPVSSGSSGVTDSNPSVESDSAGNFLVVWTRNIQAGQAESMPMGRFFGADGSLGGNEFQLNETTTGVQFNPVASLNDDGSFVVAYVNNPSYLVYDNKGRKSGLRSSSAIAVDSGVGVAFPTGGGNGNGVFEPGETVQPQTAWVNDTAAGVSVSGTAVAFTGPAGAAYAILDSTASYGTIPAGTTGACGGGQGCYSISVSDPAVRPAPHWDARLQELLSVGEPHTWILHVGESFGDVPTSHLFYRFIETLLHNGVTGGCAGGGYCPSNPVTRGQMAVFLLKAKFGSGHIPPPCTGTVFDDVPCTGAPFDPWIEELASLNITGGCGGGNYCPNNPVTRQQMAVFLLRTLEGSGYLPPDCAGLFSDVPCTPGAGFSDWIEELYDRGITGGCGVAPLRYCPTNPNNRGQMAVFLVKTFGLVLYGG